MKDDVVSSAPSDGVISQLTVFAGQISSEGRLDLAIHRPKRWARLNRCFENAASQVKQKGGSTTFGWMFLYRLVEKIPGHGYLIAVRHAVWRTPNGRLIDITPLNDDPNRPLLRKGSVIFLADAGSTTGPRPSIFYPLDADERLTAHVRQLQEVEDGRFAQG
jgi:hypothetical protein